MKGHFAYITGYLLCGGCGSSMMPYHPPTPIDNEYTYRLYCGNPTCPNYLEVYEPSDKIKVSLIPTRLRAIDPNVIVHNQAQAQVRAAREAGRPPTVEELRSGVAVIGGGGPTAPNDWGPAGTIMVDNPREWTRITNVNATPRATLLDPNALRPR